MAAPISPVASIPPIAGDALPVSATQNSEGGFGAVLSSAIESVAQARRVSDGAVERFLSGDGEELHSMVLATQRAELTFELFLQMRNKVVQAYQEVMRMQT